jgi:FKBP-type peptidyl-prolyl cis-trans isomerase
MMNRLFPNIIVALGLIAAAGCTSTSRSTSPPSGLAYTVVTEGTGPAATSGQYVSIHEAVTFTDGRALYSTRSGSPVRFLLGGGQVIAGVDELVTGMRVGERRTAVVPPALSHRDSYPEGVSPDDSLHYDVELVEIEGL